MIEIIGMEKSGEGKKEYRSLPKNVRQIGEGAVREKIYIEDYVVTYLNRMARPDQAYARGAILFGNVYDTEEGMAVFVSGAVEAGNLELDMDETVFNETVWYELIEKGEKYFPGQEVVGWFLSRIGFSVEINQKIIDTHINNFSGNYKVLYMIDSLEKEDAMYLCENRQMKRQRGYYIYYEKNSAMREYMLTSEKGTGVSSEERTGKTELRRDKKVINSYRRMNHYSRNNKKKELKIQAVRVACGVLIFVMGIYIAGRLGSRFANLGFEDYAVATFRAVKNVFGESEQEPADEQIKQGEQYVTENLTEQDITETDNGQTEESLETAVYQKPIYYIVQKGDTLAAISRKMYSSDRYTGQIAIANNLSNADQIYEGQKIIIPTVE